MDDLLQPSLQGDARMEALARLITRLSGLPTATPIVNLFDLVDASALASLGEQFHVMGVEGWNLAATEEARRTLLKKAIELHRHKGTPWAVEEALRATGFTGAEVREGRGACRHDGEIAHNGSSSYYSGNRWALFDIEIDLGDSAGMDAASRARVRETVNAWKNARSHLRAMSWRSTMEDGTDCTDETRLAVRPEYDDRRKWGFPLHDGSIRYNNGLFRTHDGRLFHDGKHRYTRWEPFGHLHDARLEQLDVAVQPILADMVRYVPLHNGALRYEGEGRHGALESAAVDDLQSRVAVPCRDVAEVRESVATALNVNARDEVGRYHDGSITHGQRYISLHNGAFFHDGSRSHGPFGGRADFSGVRHDGRSRHDGQARHSLWGWLPKAGERAPVFTYATLSDVCAVAVRLEGTAGMEDAFSLTEDVAVRVLRYTLHNGTAFHNSGPQYGGKELV